MDLGSAKEELADLALSARPPEDSIRHHIQQIHQAVLAQSRYMRQADFTAIHPEDLEFLFHAYDVHFFEGRGRQALAGRELRFRLSPRMTRTGGTTTLFKAKTGELSYEIAIASSILFDQFGETERRVTVCGLECETRLDALQRIFEHELVHLTEQLCWDRSDCKAARFQEIASRLFLHKAHTHNLVTRRERAAGSGIRAGSRVTFIFEGQRFTGRVNRITKRATVLVEHPDGQKYSDGVRYRTYYVPLSSLAPISEHGDSSSVAGI